MNIERRLLIYTSISFFILTLVALMVLPMGLPVIDHPISYWWSDSSFQQFVGQDGKWIWYRRAFYSFAFLIWLGGTAWIWSRLYAKAANWKILLVAYVVMCSTAIGSQYLVMNNWRTHAFGNVVDIPGDSRSIVNVVASIDSAANFLKDVPKYQGVDGKLKGTLAIKAPAYVLMFYFADKIGQVGLRAIGHDVADLDARAVGIATVMILVIGLFLIPLFHLLRMLFSEKVARFAVVVLSMNPLVAHGFSHMYILSHHLMILVSAVCLLMAFHGLKRGGWPWIAASLAIAAAVMLVIWDSIALIGLVAFLAGLFYYRNGYIKKLSKIQILAIAGGIAGAIALAWIILKVTIGMDIFVFFYDHFVLAHMVYLWNKTSWLNYFLTLPTNITTILYFIGVPLCVQLYFSLREEWKLGFKKNRLAGFMIWGGIVFILVLDTSGMSSETSRLWAFLVPVFYVMIFAEFDQISDAAKLRALALGLYGLQGLNVLINRSVYYSL